MAPSDTQSATSLGVVQLAGDGSGGFDAVVLWQGHILTGHLENPFRDVSTDDTISLGGVPLGANLKQRRQYLAELLSIGVTQQAQCELRLLDELYDSGAVDYEYTLQLLLCHVGAGDESTSTHYWWRVAFHAAWKEIKEAVASNP